MSALSGTLLTVRPLRLLLDGFGTYRAETEVDFTDVDFFALTGPTGSGKSTVVDALCFALYGTVPRWESAARRCAARARSYPRPRPRPCLSSRAVGTSSMTGSLEIG